MLYQPRPVLQTGEDIGVKHIIADIVHGALACALSVLATMIMAVRLAVLPVLPIGQRPAAIRTFYQSGKNLRCTILALPTAVCYLLLYLPENLFADNRLLRVLHPHPFTLGLAYPPFVLKGNVRFPVVDGMADIGFIFHNALDLGYRPCVAFFLRRTRIDVCESPVTLEVDKSRSGNLFRNQYACDTGRLSAMKGKVKNLLHYPAGFLVDYQLVFDFRVFPVPDGGIGADTLSCGKLRCYITQKKLAEKIGVSASQLSRIVSGETRTVSSDILIGVAKEFKVSTDYILGLSTVSVRKSYDISELGLSEGAVRGLVTGAVDVQILNRLLEHRNFPKLIDLIRIYFQDTAAKGIIARNQLIEIATASLSDMMKEHPEHRTEARQDLQLLNAQKMGEHEAEIEKIKSVFLAILRDIKKDMEKGEQPGEAVTAAMFQTMRDALVEQKQKPISVDDVTAMIAGQIGQLAPMDEETADLFQQLAKKMIEQAGKEI